MTVSSLAIKATSGLSSAQMIQNLHCTATEARSWQCYSAGVRVGLWRKSGQSTEIDGSRAKSAFCFQFHQVWFRLAARTYASPVCRFANSTGITADVAARTTVGVFSVLLSSQPLRVQVRRIILEKTKVSFVVPGSPAFKPIEGNAILKGDEVGFS
eukprot:3486539-Rhodomonas_salina.1